MTLTRAIEIHRAGRVAEAESIYRDLLASEPDRPDVLHLLGLALHQQGRFDEARERIARAIALRPDVASWHSNLGTVLAAMGRMDEAIAEYRAAVQLQPDLFDALKNLARALLDSGHPDESVEVFRRAIALRPREAEVLFFLGNALRRLGRTAEAATSFRRAVELRDDFAEAWNNLGNALQRTGGHDEAIAAHRRATALQPDYAEAWSNLGNGLKDVGQLDEAIDCYRRSLALRPGPTAGSNLVYATYFHPEYDAARIRVEHLQWNERHLPRIGIPRHENVRDPERRLRIGYVSPDFYHQAEVFFVLPLLRAHDHKDFEIHCYSSVLRPDAMTAALRRCADGWHDAADLSDERLAEKIRADRIDVLIDLTMHMARNRLLTFARKPAPVQAAWLAYPGTTGLPMIDWRLTDARIDPPGMDESVYSERSLRLPDAWCCYDSLSDAAVATEPPSARSGVVTFGSLNNFCKINPAVLSLWAKVLNTVERSRLLLLSPPGSHRERLLKRMGDWGIDSDRIEFVGSLPRQEYLRRYDQIDIALDPFPYNGITTTCDALWMGVPVIAMTGDRAASRAAASLLATAGYSEWIADDANGYVQLAERLASDPAQLGAYRSTLRARVQASPLMDASRFARAFESACRAMWRRWCETG